MNIKVEELSTGEVNVTFGTTVVVDSWSMATSLIGELKDSIKSYEVKRA